MLITYIILVITLTLATLLLFKKVGKKKVGCMFSSITFIVMIPMALLLMVLISYAYQVTSFVFNHIIEGNISLIPAKGWVLLIAFDSSIVLLIVGLFSILGYKLKGHQPKACKAFWWYLNAIIVRSLLLLMLIGTTLFIVFAIYLKCISSILLNDAPFEFFFIIFIVGIFTFLGSVKLASYYLYPSKEDLNLYNPTENKDTFQSLDKKNGSLDEMKGKAK